MVVLILGCVRTSRCPFGTMREKSAPSCFATFAYRPRPNATKPCMRIPPVGLLIQYGVPNAKVSDSEFVFFRYRNCVMHAVYYTNKSFKSVEYFRLCSFGGFAVIFFALRNLCHMCTFPQCSVPQSDRGVRMSDQGILVSKKGTQTGRPNYKSQR